MFIQNNHGELVNPEYILAMKIEEKEKPYQIHVFTEKTETIFEFDCKEDVVGSVQQISKICVKFGYRWAEFNGWRFRTDKIVSINDDVCRNLTVSMAGRDFPIHLNAKSDVELEFHKKRIASSFEIGDREYSHLSRINAASDTLRGNKENHFVVEIV